MRGSRQDLWSCDKRDLLFNQQCNLRERARPRGLMSLKMILFYVNSAGPLHLLPPAIFQALRSHVSRSILVSHPVFSPLISRLARELLVPRTTSWLGIRFDSVFYGISFDDRFKHRDGLSLNPFPVSPYRRFSVSLPGLKFREGQKRRKRSVDLRSEAERNKDEARVTYY